MLKKASCKLLKKIQRRGAHDGDRVGQRGREIHEHEHANTNTNSSETIERNEAYGSFSSLEFLMCRHADLFCNTHKFGH